MQIEIRQLLQQLPNRYEYSDPQKVQHCIWRVLHGPSDCWHRIKISNDEKQHYFLQQESQWLQRLDNLSSENRLINYHKLLFHQLLITPYLQGELLSERIRHHNGQRLVDAGSLIISLYQQLQNCHRAGLVHADIKPNNLLIGDNGTIHLLDFANAGLEGELVAERAYRGYSPSYALPSFQQGRGHYTDLVDWYAFLIVMRLMLGGGLAQPDWSGGNAVSEAFVYWIDQAGFTSRQQMQLSNVCLALDSASFS